MDGWTIQEVPTATSTNLVAAGLPPWHALRADTQTAGRGRFERAWVSDRGGLWLSAVVPAPPASALPGLPLTAGLAVCQAVAQLGVKGVRMRWPNDVLVGDRKLAGLLVDHFAPDRFVVGIGVNVANDPESNDPQLKDRTARLVDLVTALPPLQEITRLVLTKLRLLVEQLARDGFGVLATTVNRLWGPPREIELTLDNAVARGRFAAVDDAGRLLLQTDLGTVESYPPAKVRHLRELP